LSSARGRRISQRHLDAQEAAVIGKSESLLDASFINKGDVESNLSAFIGAVYFFDCSIRDARKDGFLNGRRGAGKGDRGGRLIRDAAEAAKRKEGRMAFVSFMESTARRLAYDSCGAMVVVVVMPMVVMVVVMATGVFVFASVFVFVFAFGEGGRGKSQRRQDGHYGEKDVFFSWLVWVEEDFKG